MRWERGLTINYLSPELLIAPITRLRYQSTGGLRYLSQFLESHRTIHIFVENTIKQHEKKM